MNKFFTKIATLSIGLMMAIGVGVAVSGNKGAEKAKADDVVYKEVTFSSSTMSDSVDNYTSTWTNTTTGTTGITVSLTNFSNHNKGWDYVKCGRKSNTSVATITTSAAIDQAITKVDITLDSIKNTNSIKLYTSSNGSSWTAETTQYTKSSGTQSVSVETPTANLYYKLEFDCTSGSNGSVVLSKIEYYKASSGPVDTRADLELACDDLEMDISDNPVTLEVTATSDDEEVTGLSYTFESGDEDIVTIDEDTGEVTPVAVGSTTITISFPDGDETYKPASKEINVTVSDKTNLISDFKPGTNGYSDSTEKTAISWSNSVAPSYPVYLGGVSYTVYGTDSNTGKYYTDGGIRLYCSGSSTLTVDVGSDYEITSITIKFTNSSLYSDSARTDALSSNTAWTPDDSISSKTFYVASGSSGHLRVSEVVTVYKAKVAVVPTYATVEFKSGYGTYYSGSTISGKYTFSTANVIVKTFDDDDTLAQTYEAGTGFILTVNNEDLDARSTVQTLSFKDATPGSYKITVVVKGVGAEGADVDNSDQDPEVDLEVVAKNVTALAWNNEQTATFVAFAQKLHIDGTFTPTWNDDSDAVAFPITTEVYTGESPIEVNKIYTASNAYATHNAGFDITKANVPDKSLSVDEEGRLTYTAASTKFYVQMYYTAYPSVKIGKVITVVQPTLVATDANTSNYYIGTTYDTAANAHLEYDSVNVRTLTSDDITLSPTSVTPADTTSITVTVTFKGNTNITTTYTITPSEPAALSSIDLYDEDGEEMTDGEGLVVFTAGDNFCLYNASGEDYFAVAWDEDTNPTEIDSYADFTFELLDVADAEDGSGDEITTSTVMRIGMNEKWIRATYTQGSSSVHFTYQITIDEVTIREYSLSNYFEKITDTEDLTTGLYLIVVESANSVLTDAVDTTNNITEVTIANNQIAVSDDTLALAFTYNATETSFKAPNGKYLAHTGSNNTINPSDTPVAHTVSFNANGNASIKIANQNYYLKYNGSTGQNRIRYYTSTDDSIQLYKRSSTGNIITYLKDVVDAYRLNNDVDGDSGLSICNADTSIYNSDYWKGTNGKVSVKTLFNSLTDSQLLELSVQDTFGKPGETYADTYRMLIAKEPANAQGRLIGITVGSSTATTLVTVVISMVSVTAIGGYFFLRRRKEQ